MMVLHHIIIIIIIIMVDRLQGCEKQSKYFVYPLSSSSIMWHQRKLGSKPACLAMHQRFVSVFAALATTSSS